MKREISTAQREIHLWTGCVGLCRIMPRGSADSLPLAIFYPLSSILAFGGRAAARPYRVFHLRFSLFHLDGDADRAVRAPAQRITSSSSPVINNSARPQTSFPSH